MAKEYIERDAALMGVMRASCLANTVQVLKDIPAADVVEVVHGRWVEVHRTPFGSSAYRCSVCEGYMPFYNGYNYCPNCGAKMDGGNDEN